MEQRIELAYERHPLPSRYWEPEPDEEDLERMMNEAEEQEEDIELPFE